MKITLTLSYWCLTLCKAPKVQTIQIVFQRGKNKKLKCVSVCSLLLSLWPNQDWRCQSQTDNSRVSFSGWWVRLEFACLIICIKYCRTIKMFHATETVNADMVIMMCFNDVGKRKESEKMCGTWACVCYLQPATAVCVSACVCCPHTGTQRGIVWWNCHLLSVTVHFQKKFRYSLIEM